jgi:mRNA-degrading endonuclease RelE of RelBE toxin-antitoxin system
MTLTINTVEHFDKSVKKLQKRYKQLVKDLKVLKQELLQNPFCGVKLTHNCYKLRLASSSVPTGKNGEFRVIYYYIQNNQLYLLEMYSKTDIENIDENKLIAILKENDLA